MSMEITTLGFVSGVNLDDSNFSSTEILNAETVISTYITNRFPSVDVTPGTTLYDLVIRPAAIVYLTNRAQLEAFRATGSILGIKNNPSLANSSVLDSIVSNFLIERRTGTSVTGNLRVNVSRNSSYLIQQGQQFTAPNGLVYESISTINATINPSLPTDVQLYASDATNTQWYFIVPVIAQNTGTQYILSGQPQFTMTPSMANLISIFAFGGFNSATNGETNDELISRIPDALSARNLVSRSSIRSVLKSNFSSVISVGVCGFGDAALRRGADNIFGIKTGGVADVWVKTAPYPESRSFQIVANKVDSSATGDIFEFTVSSDLFPGHYFVSSITDASQPIGVIGSFPIVSQSKSIPSSGTQHVMSSSDQGAYSIYQSTTVRFNVPPDLNSQPVYSGTNVTFNVEVIGCPDIDTLQNYVGNYETRPAGMDYLVKAAIPCFISISPITVHGVSSTDVGAVIQAICNYINTLQSGDSISVDSIISSIKDITGVQRVELPITISGRIVCPDGSFIDIFSNDLLEIKTVASKQVSPDSVAFFVSPENVPVSSILLN